MSLRRHFINAVKSDFFFLAKAYDFTLVLPESDSSLESLRYENLPLFIEIGWYKGELDIIVGYSGETPILRPYLSRIFTLSEIALHLDSRALQEAPSFPNYITGESEISRAVAYWARIMKTYCSEILSGDIHILEEIALRRTGPLNP